MRYIFYYNYFITHKCSDKSVVVVKEILLIRLVLF